MMEKKISRNDKGFSLIELIIVIAIMVILVGIIIPLFVSYVKRSERAKDIYNANQIATATYVAFADNVGALSAFENWKGLPTTVSATVDGVTETYKVYLVAANEGPIYCFKGGESKFGNKSGSTGFYGTLNAQLGLSTTKENHIMKPKHQAVRAGSGPKAGYSYEKVDRWRLCKRADNGSLEVWVAQPHPYGGFPIYRLWPNPDDEYTRVP